MFNLEKLRLPYREDSAFSLLAFAVFLIPLAFFLLTNENYETAKFSVFLVLTGCALWAFLKRQNKGRLVLAYNRPLFILLGLFLAWAVVSTVFSVDILYSLFGFYYRFTDSLLFYLVLSTFLILLVSIIDRAKFIFLLKILVFDALIVAIVACLQAVGITYYAGVSLGGGFIQGPSLLGNPDFSAMFMAAVFPFSLVFLINSAKFNSKIYYGLCAFVILASNLLLASRGALLAIVAGIFLALALLLIFRFEKKFFFGLLLLVLLVSGFGAEFLKVSRPAAISSIIQSVDLNTTARLEAWQISLKGVADHPFFGSGPGTFALFFERARSQSMASQVGVFDDPHNIFLRMAAAEGIPFVLIFVLLMATALYYAGKRLRQEKDLLTLACMASLVVWCVGASFNPVPVPMFMLLGVLLSGLIIGNTKSKDLNLKFRLKWPIYVFAAMLIVFGADLTVSEYVFGFAKRAYLNQDYQTGYKLSEAAWKINPTNALYKVYGIGSEIGLNAKPEIIIKDINSLTPVHKNQAASYVTASNLYALLYQTTGNKVYLQSALAQMNRALGIDKFYAERYGQRALYFYQLGDLDSAKNSLDTSLSLKSDEFSSWVLLAKIYQSRGEKTQTVFALTKAFKLRPDILQLGYLLRLAKILPDIKQVPIPVAAAGARLE